MPLTFLAKNMALNDKLTNVSQHHMFWGWIKMLKLSKNMGNELLDIQELLFLT
jgi:hypothetical protein